MLRRYTLHGSPVHRANAGQGTGGVFYPVDMLPLGIKGIRVNIDLMALVVPQHEVPVLGIVTEHLSITSSSQQLPQFRNILVLDCDVEVAVGSCLLAQQRIDPPATVEPHLDTVTFEQIDD